MQGRRCAGVTERRNRAPHDHHTCKKVARPKMEEGMQLAHDSPYTLKLTLKAVISKITNISLKSLVLWETGFPDPFPLQRHEITIAKEGSSIRIHLPLSPTVL